MKKESLINLIFEKVGILAQKIAIDFFEDENMPKNGSCLIYHLKEGVFHFYPNLSEESTLLKRYWNNIEKIEHIILQF